MKKNVLIIQPHSDDALLSCSKYLFSKKNRCTVLTVEYDPKRLNEDSNVSNIIGVPYVSIGIEDVKDGLYHNYFKRYGRNAVLNDSDVINFYYENIGGNVLQNLTEAIEKYVNDFIKNNQECEILCPVGCGHPFHFLVRRIVDTIDVKNIIYYKDFPHAYKKKNLNHLAIVTQNMNVSEEYDNKEISELKYTIAQKFYRSQSGFFFYEHDRIEQHLPEVFYSIKKDSTCEDKKERHLKIYVISKNRPDGKTFFYLNSGEVEYTVVVEPQDEDAYRSAGHKNILTLPENDRGIAYVTNFAKNMYDGINPIMILDDDITGFYESLAGINKCSPKMKTRDEIHDFFARLEEAILNEDFDYGTIGRSQFDWGATNVKPNSRYGGLQVARIINNPILKKFDFDESLPFKADMDYALKCMYLGLKYRKFTQFMQQTRMNKNGKQEGGLQNLYKYKLIEEVNNIMLERWSGNIEIDEKKKANNGVVELRVTYKCIDKQPAVIEELKKELKI